ncbi:MAG: endonuclease/exonuclease/phosphatase family protein [Planctomycetaceae bacterium]
MMFSAPPIRLCLILVTYCSALQGAVFAQETNTEKLVRVATFNCSLNRDKAGELHSDLTGGKNSQARKVARILRTIRPQIVLLNEFDYAEDNKAVTCFLQEYLAAKADWAPEEPISYAHFFTAPVNTGVPSGRDLDHDGKSDGPGDAIGFGRFPGQYGMVVLSQFPIQTNDVRTFQKLLWKSMPGAVLPPSGKNDSANWYNDEDLNLLRLSSKSHWDVPVKINGQVLHILASHPTPPAFDGPEDRNGRRNHDEIRLWAEYLSEEQKSWLVDDQGRSGTLPTDAAFVILGDQNADPNDGASYQIAINQLLKHPRINSNVTPSSIGGSEAAKAQGGKNSEHHGDHAHDTADFNDRGVGNLRADYVLPSKNLNPVAAGIFWPPATDPASKLADCSDHRLVWVDLKPDTK